ncbi:hypothetical protein LCGC14_3100390 [marine sediment metagenome]|uniref:Uncharacterized protein n=1 Tax=marine sediment metagenome TaxID=412755 RepID=A0A0F8YFI0_9ZZZZ
MFTREKLQSIKAEARTTERDAKSAAEAVVNKSWKKVLTELAFAAERLAHAADIVDAYTAR